jgi:glycerol-3-phosphate O-acyltransferase/dihydroxyacetone phosphate acyltransferase
LHRYRFRAKVLLQFGEPIKLTEQMVERFKLDEKQAINEFMHEYEQRMLQLTVNTPDWETYHVLQTIRRVWTPNWAVSTVSLLDIANSTRTLTKVHKRCTEENNIEAKEVYEQAANYLHKLRAIRVKDEHLQLELNPFSALALLIGSILYIPLLAPFLLVGLFLNGPGMIMGRVGANIMISKGTYDVITTYMGIGGTFTLYAYYPILFTTTLIVLLSFTGFSWWLLILPTMVLLAIIHYLAYDEYVNAWSNIRIALRTLLFANEIKQLRLMRNQLQQRVCLLYFPFNCIDDINFVNS